MTVRIASVAVLLLVGLDWTMPSPARAQPGVSFGGGCSQAIANVNRTLRDYNQRATDQGLEFLREDALSAAGEAVEPIISSSPTLSAAAEVRDYYSNLESFRAKLKRLVATLDSLMDCLDRPGCRLGDLAAAQNKAIWEWLKSLGDERLPANVQRVQKANSLLRAYTRDLESSAEGNINSALSCLKDYDVRLKGKSDAVDLRNQPAGQPPTQPPTQTKPKPSSGAKSGGGMSPSTTVALAAAGAGLAVAGVGLAQQAAKEAEAANCDAQEATTWDRVTAMSNAANAIVACGSNSSCINSRMSAFVSAWNSAASALGNWCTCMGANVNDYLSSSEKASIREWWSYASAMGLNPGTMPNCFR